MADQYQHGRGVALADFNGDGKTDIVYGNWNGPHRLFLQGSDSDFRVRNNSKGFDRVTPELVLLLRTLLAEGLLLPLLFAQSLLPTLTMTRSWRCFSTIFSTEKMLPTEFSGNTIVSVHAYWMITYQGCLHILSDLRVSRRANADPLIEELNVGDAAEPQGRGTGQLS